MSESERHLRSGVLHEESPFPRIFEALSDPTRLKILRFVEHERRTVQDLVTSFTVSPPTIRRHLSALEEADLVVKEHKGRKWFYRVNTEVLVNATYVMLCRAYEPRRVPVVGRSLPELLRDESLNLTPDELIDTAAGIASNHPDLRGRGAELRSMLAWESSKASIAHALAGGPRRLLTNEQLEEELQVRIASQAIANIWQEGVLEPRQVAVALGAKETNREKVSSLRRRSQLLGLPREASYLYPEFQLDLPKRRIHPEAREVNEILRAAEDPWGVASWWVSDNDRLAARPVDLLASARSEEVVEAAKVMTGPIG